MNLNKAAYEVAVIIYISIRHKINLDEFSFESQPT